MSENNQPLFDRFSQIEVPEGTLLRRVQRYEFTTTEHIYDIELFENQDSTFYAIGVPRSNRIVVYGSNIVPRADQALQIVIDKIQRDPTMSNHPNA